MFYVNQINVDNLLLYVKITAMNIDVINLI